MRSGDDYLMNETRRKPSTGTQCPTNFPISVTGSFICPVTLTQLDRARPVFTQSWTTDTAGHTKAFINAVMGHWGESQSAPAQGNRRTADLLVHSRTRQPPDHNDRPKFEDQLYSGSSTGGGSSPYGGGGRLRKHPRHMEAIPRGPGAKTRDVIMITKTSMIMSV